MRIGHIRNGNDGVADSVVDNGVHAHRDAVFGQDLEIRNRNVRFLLIPNESSQLMDENPGRLSPTRKEFN